MNFLWPKKIWWCFAASPAASAIRAPDNQRSSKSAAAELSSKLHAMRLEVVPFSFVYGLHTQSEVKLSF